MHKKLAKIYIKNWRDLQMKKIVFILLELLLMLISIIFVLTEKITYIQYILLIISEILLILIPILFAKKTIQNQKLEIQNLNYICDATRTFRHDFNNIMQAIRWLYNDK
jgi:ABC-type polysaccharide/polyol phosphate export permease